jgi:protein-L-isoaspartate(D-aspartate) O-methyltransferase
MFIGVRMIKSQGMKDFSSWRREAINDLVDQNILRSPSVIAAMLKVPREEFLPPDVRDEAYVDSPLPIRFGQTTSALHMTALLCEYSEMRLGQHVLEVGGGCGYMSCVYAEVVASGDHPPIDWGHVWTVEIVPELAHVGQKNVERMGYSKRVTFMEGDASEGLDNGGSFDVILTTSAAPGIPDRLIGQLNPGGILLIPVGHVQYYQELVRVRKSQDGTLSRENLGGVAFVPMRGKRGWSL